MRTVLALLLSVLSVLAQQNIGNPFYTASHLFASGPTVCAMGLTGIGQTNTTTGATSYTLATSNTPVVNSLMLVGVASGVTGGPPVPTLAGHGTTWVLIATTNWGNYRVSLFRSMTNNTPTATDVTVSFGASSQWGCNMRGVYITNVNTSGTWGSGAITQSTMLTNSTADPVLTLSALSGSTNAVYAYFVNAINGYGGTIDAGWTQDINNGFNTTATGQYGQYAIATSDNTPSHTRAATAWGGIAVEIQKACP